MTTQDQDDYEKRWNKIRVTESTGTIRQRIISNRGFSGSSVLRQYSILIQASDPSSFARVCLWIGKVSGVCPLSLNPTIFPTEQE